MRKYIPLLLMMILALLVSACGKGTVSDVCIGRQYSGIYTQKEMDDAIQLAINYFRNEFEGCKLLEIAYVGDEGWKAFEEWADQYGVDQVIILVSSFETGPDGGDGSLNPNDTYKNWQWVLGRSNGGKWKHLTHGYG